jgi:putative transcriptional regulator
MATTRRESRILDEMHETARGLHRAGLINKRRMGEFAALCRLDVHEMTPQTIKALRQQAHASQAVFAAGLNTSVSTVQKWEVGDNKPSGPSLKLLNLVERKGLEAIICHAVRARFTSCPSPPSGCAEKPCMESVDDEPYAVDARVSSVGLNGHPDCGDERPTSGLSRLPGRSGSPIVGWTGRSYAQPPCVPRPRVGPC